jgi:hypothetical protein
MALCPIVIYASVIYHAIRAVILLDEEDGDVVMFVRAALDAVLIVKRELDSCRPVPDPATAVDADVDIDLRGMSDIIPRRRRGGGLTFSCI